MSTFANVDVSGHDLLAGTSGWDLHGKHKVDLTEDYIKIRESRSAMGWNFNQVVFDVELTKGFQLARADLQASWDGKLVVGVEGLTKMYDTYTQLFRNIVDAIQKLTGWHDTDKLSLYIINGEGKYLTTTNCEIAYLRGNVEIKIMRRIGHKLTSTAKRSLSLGNRKSLPIR